MTYALARLDPAPERPPTWRTDCRRALLAALRAGELDLRTFAMLNVFLDVSNASGGDRRWFLRTLGQWVGGRSARTAGRWTARAIAAGWLQRHHYRKVDEATGQWSTGANRWRVMIPERWEAWLADNPRPAPPPAKGRNRRGDRRGWPAPLPVEAVEALAAPTPRRAGGGFPGLAARAAAMAQRAAADARAP